MGLFSLFSNDDAEKAAQQRNQGLQQGYDALSSQYGMGRDALNSNYGNASGLWNSLMGSANAGGNAYADASGANGSGGLQRATQNFESSPQYGAYGFSLDQGLQALNRTHAAAGNLSSGNADTDAMKYASGLAGQQYNSYLSGLAPYLSQQTAATQGGAGASTGLGNALNQSYQGQGAAANKNYTDQGASTAAATMNNYQIGKNELGAITAAGQLAFGMPPTALGSIGGDSSGGGSSGGSSGSLVSGLGGLFSSFGGATPGAYGGSAPNYGQSYNIGYGGQNMPVFGGS